MCYFMDDKLKRAEHILKKYNQEHLLQFYDELTEDERELLIDQILSIDFDEILYLYEKSKIDVLDSTEEVEPLPYIIKSLIPNTLEKNILHLDNRLLVQGKLLLLL